MGATVTAAAIRRQWMPEAGEPRLDWGQLQQQSRNQDAPIALAYGDEPPRKGTRDISRRIIERAWWPEPDEPRLSRGQLQQTARNFIAPLVLTYGDTAPLTRREREQLRAVREHWEPPWTGPQTAPNGPIPGQGEQPPRSSREALAALLRAWDPAWTPEQRPAPPAGWNIPLVSGFLPPARVRWQIWDAWVPPWVGPPPLVTVAPLALTYGQDPPRLSRAQLRAVLAAWEPPFLAAQGSPRAGWLQPLTPYLPPPGVPWAVWQAWADPERHPPRAAQIVALARTYGQPPPIAGTSRATLRAILAQWQPGPWGAQGWTKVGGILFPQPTPERPPVTGVRAAILTAILATWREPFRYPPSLIILPQSGDAIIPAGLPLSGVLCTAHFTTDARPAAQVALLTGGATGDRMEVICVCGSFEPDDVIASAIFLAKLSASDAGNAPTNIRRTIQKSGPTYQGRIASIGTQTEKQGLLFELSGDDNAALITPHVYTIQVTVTRDGVSWPKVVQRGTIQSIQSITARTGLVVLLTTEGGDYLATEDGDYLSTE